MTLFGLSRSAGGGWGGCFRCTGGFLRCGQTTRLRIESRASFVVSRIFVVLRVLRGFLVPADGDSRPASQGHSGYFTSARKRPRAGGRFQGRAELSTALGDSAILRTIAGASRPLPTSRSSPTMCRTILCRKAFALKMRCTQGPSITRLASITVRTVVSPFQSLEQNTAKSCRPTKPPIASSTSPASNRWQT